MVSRHQGNLNSRLIDLGIHQLLHEVIHITDGRPKSEFIKERNSIFVDDSFVERGGIDERRYTCIRYRLSFDIAVSF